MSEMNYKITAGDKTSKVKLMGLKDEIGDKCLAYSKIIMLAFSKRVNLLGLYIKIFTKNYNNLHFSNEQNR